MEDDYSYSDSYAQEHHYEPETHPTYVEAEEVPQETTDPQQHQQKNNKQQYQSRSPLPSSQPAQTQYANPKYPPHQSPSHYTPQAIPQNFPPQANYQHPPQPAPAGYFPAQQPMQANPQTYQPQQQAYTAQPKSPYNPGPTARQPMYHVNGAAPGNMVPQSPYQPAGTVSWTTGLFDCMDDPNNALITAFFPMVTFGQVAEIVDNGHTTCATSAILYGLITFFIGVPCLMSFGYRSKLRNRYDLIETPAADWLTHFFCEWCALCQEYRELKNRGYDPSIGWHGNMIRNQQAPQVAMMPPAHQTVADPNMIRNQQAPQVAMMPPAHQTVADPNMIKNQQAPQVAMMPPAHQTVADPNMIRNQQAPQVARMPPAHQTVADPNMSGLAVG